MKVEELYVQEPPNQVGVTLQRIPFETEVNILPEHPGRRVWEEETTVRKDEEEAMTDLTSSQTEELLSAAIKHRAEGGDPEIPLKRIDSGPHQHRLQGSSSQTEEAHCSRNQALLDEMDSGGVEATPAADKSRTGKKESTLTRVLRGMRGEKDVGEDKPNMSLSKIFHRINPVGKASRDNFSKVFHRLGDALQKKGDDEKTPKNQGRSVKSRENRTDAGKSGEAKLGLIGGKMFKCRSSGPRDSDRALAK